MNSPAFSPRGLMPNELDEVVTYCLGDCAEDVASHIKQAADVFEWIDVLSGLICKFAETGNSLKAKTLAEIIRYLAQDHFNYLDGVAERMEATTKAAMEGGNDE